MRGEKRRAARRLDGGVQLPVRRHGDAFVPDELPLPRTEGEQGQARFPRDRPLHHFPAHRGHLHALHAGGPAHGAAGAGLGGVRGHLGGDRHRHHAECGEPAPLLQGVGGVLSADGLDGAADLPPTDGGGAPAGHPAAHLGRSGVFHRRAGVCHRLAQALFPLHFPFLCAGRHGAALFVDLPVCAGVRMTEEGKQTIA